MIGKALRGLMCAVVGFTAVGAVGTAHAGVPVTINCTVLDFGGGNGGTTFTNIPGTDNWDWALQGVASCNGDNGGQYEVTFTGAGSSEGLGICTSGSILNLSLNMDLSVYSVQEGTTKLVHENWGAPVTTFPITTPYAVTQNGNAIGLGTLFTHIFDNCPPEGTPDTVYQWVQTL
jgi:hypothetical protein